MPNKKNSQNSNGQILLPLFICRSFMIGPSASDLVRAVAKLVAAAGLLVLCYRIPPDAGKYAETVGRLIAAFR